MFETLPLTVIVHTRNSAQTLESCLQSLPRAAELLVVDMASTDATLTIAQRHQAKVIAVADVGYVEPARNVALSAATQDWILIVDADEELPEMMATWLPSLLEKNDHSVYALPRSNIVFGKALKHTGWWPDYQVRLFRNGAVTWSEKIHAKPNCIHKPEELPETEEYAIIHHNYQTIAQYVERLNRYTSIEVKAGSNASEEKQLLATQMDELCSRLFAREGWRDGEHGLALSVLQSFYLAISQLKRWETKGFPQHSTFDAELSAQLNEVKHTFAYWHTTYQIAQTHGLKRFYWRIRRKLQL